MAEDFAVRWSKAKKLFETTAKVKKPSEKVIGMFRKGTGIESALKTCDEWHGKFDGKGKTQKTLDEFKKGVKAFGTAKAGYLKTLQGAVNNEPKGADKDSYNKGIKVLETQLKALSDTLDSQTGYMESGLKNMKIVEAMAANLEKATKGACSRAAAFVAKVKANPTPKQFNDGIKDAARDITQQIGNIDKLKKKGFDTGRTEPKNLFKILDPWANNQRDLKSEATEQEVLREVGAFGQAVGGVVKWLG